MAESVEVIERQFHGELGRISDHLEALKEGVRDAGGAGQLPAEIMDALAEAYEEADREYLAAVEVRDEKLAQRAAELRQDLFGASSGAAGPAFTNALVQAHDASEA